MGVLRWRTQLDPVLAAILVLTLAACLIILYRRQRSRHTFNQTLTLLMPRVLIVILLIIAWFDPVWNVFRPPDVDKKVIILVDTSSSMAVKNISKRSRLERAFDLQEEISDRLDRYVKFDYLEFDRNVNKPGRKPSNRNRPVIRPTDLGKCLVTLAQKSDISDYMAVVLLTDGGDEMIQSPTLPEVPVYIAGMGSDPDQWNDLALLDLETPESVEEQADFNVTADVVARCGTEEFARDLGSVKATLEENVRGTWQRQNSEPVDLASRRGRVTFKVTAGTKVGPRRFRLAIDSRDGEVTLLNNSSKFIVQVEKKTLDVLFFAHELGWDFRQITRELKDDPAVALTSLLRTHTVGMVDDKGAVERYVVQGSRQAGDEVLENGFPNDSNILKMYKCIVIGSFPAVHWRETQLKALADYVRQGGCVIFLGGENAFGAGGYGQTAIEPLFPWHLSTLNADQQFRRGRFAVHVPPTSASHGMISEVADLLEPLSQVTIESINLSGPLKTGAISLMDASVGSQPASVIALQRYGSGQAMSIATNTLWKWARPGTHTGGNAETLPKAYSHFWRQAVRQSYHLSSEQEGGRFLGVQWDQDHYSPGEKARATIRVAGRYAPGELHLKASQSTEGKITNIPVTSDPGKENVFTVRTSFVNRGEYQFKLEAWKGDKRLEQYEKTLLIGPRMNEGTNLAVDHAFLKNLAAQAGGVYYRETETEQLIERLHRDVFADAVSMDVPLVQHRYIYLIIFLCLCALEWAIRRKMNLF